MKAYAAVVPACLMIAPMFLIIGLAGPAIPLGVVGAIAWVTGVMWLTQLTLNHHKRIVELEQKIQCAENTEQN